MHGIIGIGGTPGTGKKTIAPIVAELLSLPHVSLNSLVNGGTGEKSARISADATVEVDPRDIREAIARTNSSPAVVYGHLLADALRKSDVVLVAVLRCDPTILKQRLLARGYPRAKVIENVEAELIGVVLDECVRRFGPASVHEYDTSASLPHAVARAIMRDAEHPRTMKRAKGWIDWTLDYDSSTRLMSLLS